jgi:hypothetical protein
MGMDVFVIIVLPLLSTPSIQSPGTKIFLYFRAQKTQGLRFFRMRIFAINGSERGNMLHLSEFLIYYEISTQEEASSL